jgi:hypothetical protein
MARKIRISLEGTDESVTATLAEDEAPDFADTLWEELADPVRMWTVQTASTGEWFLGRARPPAQAHELGTQAAPLGKPVMMCDAGPGVIVYGGYQQLGFGYGSDVTEPLMTHGPIVARADDNDALYQLGSRVGDSHFITHQLAVVTVSREEN